MTTETPTIALVGGGISGAVMAIALLKRGINVQLYEQAHGFGEIGAGVAFSPNAVRAMHACSPTITSAFEAVATGNQTPSKKTVWFDFLDGYNDTAVGTEKFLFSLKNENGANSVRRSAFLDELVKLIPEGVCHFSKRFETIEQRDEKEKVALRFHDGTTAEADAVIGCDGIKSRTRAWMLGAEDAAPSYTYKYAYRGLIPMTRAVEALGEELATNSYMHMGKEGHMLTFPIDHGKTMNVVAFKTAREEWADDERLTAPSTKEHVFEDFKGFGATVHKVIEMLEPELDCWAIFDTGKDPMPYYNAGRVCCLGDAAHATSPHHGAGAGICIEDAAVMVELLADPAVLEAGAKGLDAAFQVFNDVRKERTQWLVQSSRRSGDLYEWRTELGEDFEKIGAECKQRCEQIWDGKVDEMVAEARQALAVALKA